MNAENGIKLKVMNTPPRASPVHSVSPVNCIGRLLRTIDSRTHLPLPAAD